MNNTFRLILAVVLFLNVHAMAQSDLALTIKYGHARSYQNWDYYGWDLVDDNYKSPFNHKDSEFYSLTLSRLVSKRISVGLEIGYSDKGSTAEATGLVLTDAGIVEDSTVHISKPLKYLEIPILIRYKLKLFNQQVFFEGGPRLDVLVDSKEFSTAITESEIAKLNLGISLGSGLSFKTGKVGRVEVGLRYNPDISKVFDNGKVRIVNSTINGFIGYQFNIR